MDTYPAKVDPLIFVEKRFGGLELGREKVDAILDELNSLGFTAAIDAQGGAPPPGNGIWLGDLIPHAMAVSALRVVHARLPYLLRYIQIPNDVGTAPSERTRFQLYVGAVIDPNYSGQRRPLGGADVQEILAADRAEVLHACLRKHYRPIR